MIIATGMIAVLILRAIDSIIISTTLNTIIIAVAIMDLTQDLDSTLHLVLDLI